MSIVNCAGGEEAGGSDQEPVSRLWDDECVRIWNEVMDEMWSLDPNEAESDGYSFDFLDIDPERDYNDLDDELPEMELVEHNIFPCN